MYLGISENGEFMGIYGKFNDQCGKTCDKSWNIRFNMLQLTILMHI
jgi:hypothetical protein